MLLFTARYTTDVAIESLVEILLVALFLLDSCLGTTYYSDHSRRLYRATMCVLISTGVLPRIQ